MTPSAKLIELAGILADWAEPAPSFQIYLFGSRVRGDHTPTSDVDVVIPFENIAYPDGQWWGSVNADEFKSIDARLPGKLAILENDDPFATKILNAPVVYRDRQVFCVWMEPKSPFEKSVFGIPLCSEA
jgi:predicted nucleotidyltransferase